MAATVTRRRQYATTEHVRAAIEALSVDESARLRYVGKVFILGTPFTEPQELINEALRSAMDGAMGREGRRWPLDVEFMAFLVMSMRSIANGSLSSLEQTLTDHIEDLAPEGSLDQYKAAALAVAGVDLELCDVHERQVVETKAAQAWTKLEELFCDDDEVMLVLIRLLDGQRPRQIQQEESMTKTQYETVRKRLRRGLNKLGFVGSRL